MKNQYRIDGDLLYIQLDSRDGTTLETVTEAKHLEKLIAFDVKWIRRWSVKTKTFYVQSTGFYVDGKRKTTYLHRFIMDAKKTKDFIDHINHDTLDNREENLRFSNMADNMKNRKDANENSTTGIRNVMIDRKYNKYKVVVYIEGKHRHFGSFDEDDLDLAGELAELVRQKYFGT